MPDLYFSTNLSNDTMLCLAPLSEKKAISVSPDFGDNPSGYFLYECKLSEGEDDVSVIARVLSDDAAWRLSRLLGME